MNNAFKRTISGVLALSMVASTVPVVSAEDAVVYSGYPLVSISEGEEYYIFTKDTNGKQAKPTSPMFSTLIDPYSVLDMSSKDIKPNFWVDYAKAYTDSTANETGIGIANDLSTKLFELKAKTNQDINTYYKTISKFNALTEKAYTTIGSADCGYGNALYAELKDPSSKTNKILHGTNELYMFLWGTTQPTIDYTPDGASSSVPGSPILNMYDLAVQSGILPVAKEDNNHWGFGGTEVLDPLSSKNYTFDALSDIASKVYKGGATTTVKREESNEGGYKGAGDDVEYKDIRLLGYDTTVYAPAFPTREFFMPSQNTYSQNENKPPIYMKYFEDMVKGTDGIIALDYSMGKRPQVNSYNGPGSAPQSYLDYAEGVADDQHDWDEKFGSFVAASQTARAYPSWYSVKFNGNDRIEYEVADNDESKYASAYTNDYNLTYSQLLEMFKNTLGIYTDAHNAVTSMNALPVKSDLFCTETAIYNPVAEDSITEASDYYDEAYNRLLKYYNTMTSDTSEIATSPEWSNGMLNMGNKYIDLNIESYNHFLEAINTYPVTVTGEWLGIADEGKKIPSHTLGVANPIDTVVVENYLIDPISDVGDDKGASVALHSWLGDKDNAATRLDWETKHTDEDGELTGRFEAIFKSEDASDPAADSSNSHKWSYDIVWHDTSVEKELPLIDRPAAFDITSDSNYSYTNKWQNSLSGNRSGYTIGQFTGVSRDYFDENAKAYAAANKTTVDASAPTMSVNVTTYDSTGENGSVEKVENHTYGLWHYNDTELGYTPKLQYNTLIGRADDGFGADIDSEDYDTYSQLLKDHSLAISGTNNLYDADFFDALRYFEVEWFGGTSFPIDMEEYKAAYEAYKASCEALKGDYEKLDILLKGDKYKEAYKMYAIAENEADLYDYSDLSKIGVNVSKVNKSAILKGVASGDWSVTANWNSKGRQSEVTPYMAVNVLDGNADNERLDNSTYNPKHPEVRTVSNDIEELKKYGYYVGSGTDSKGNSYDISGALKKQGVSIKVYRKDANGSTVELTEDKALRTKLNDLIPQDNTSGVKASEVMSIVKEYEYGQVTDDFTNLPDNLKDEKYRQASKYNDGSKYVIQIAVLYTNVPTDAWLYDEPTVSADTSADWLVTEIPEYSLSEYYESLYDVPTLDMMNAQLEKTVNANVKVISDGLRGTDKTGLYTNYKKFVNQLTGTEKERSQTVKSGPKPIAITNDVKPLIDVAMEISDSFNKDSNPVKTTPLDKLTALKYYVEDAYKNNLDFNDAKSVIDSDAYKNMKIIRYTAAVKNTSYTAVQRICQEIEQFNSLLEENKGYTVTTDDGEDDVFIKVNSNTIHQTDNKGNTVYQPDNNGNSNVVPDLYWTDNGMVESHNGGAENILVDMHVFVSKNSNEDGIYFADWGTGKTYTKAASEVLKSIDMADENHMTSLSGKTSRIFFGGQSNAKQRITSGGTTTSTTNIRINSQSTDANYSDWVFSKHTESSDVYWCANCGALLYGDDINDHFVHTEQVIIGYDAPPPIVVSGGSSGGGEDGDADGVPNVDANGNMEVTLTDGTQTTVNVADVQEVQNGNQVHHETVSFALQGIVGSDQAFKVTLPTGETGYVKAVSKNVGINNCLKAQSNLSGWDKNWNWFSYANQGGGSTGGGSGSYGSEEYSGMIPQYEERIVYSCTGPFINVGVWKIKEMLGVDSQINEDYTIADADEPDSLAHGSYADIGINYVDSALITDILPEFNDNFENELPDFASSLGLVIDPEHATVISTTDISKQPTYEGSLSQGWVRLKNTFDSTKSDSFISNDGQLVSNTLDTYYGTLNGDTEIARFQFGGDMSNSEYRANVVLMFITQSLADGYLRYRDNSEQEIADYLANVEAARNADPDAEDINAFNRGDLSWDLYRQQAYVEIYNYVLNKLYPDSDKTLNECIAAFLQKEITSTELLSDASLTYLNKKNRWGAMSTDALNAIVKSINDDGRTFSGSSGLSFFNVSSPSTLNSTGGIFSEFTEGTYSSDSNNKVMSVIKDWTEDMGLRVEARTDRWGSTFETSDMKTSYEYKYVDVGDARSMEWSAKPTDINNGHGNPGVVRDDGLGHNGIITSDESFKGSTYFTNNSLGNEVNSHGWKIESINTVDTINNIDTLMVSGSSVKTDRDEASNAQGITVSGTVGTTKLNISYSCLTYGDAEVGGSFAYNFGDIVIGADGGYEWADPNEHIGVDGSGPEGYLAEEKVMDIDPDTVEVTSIRFHLPAWSMPMLVVVDFPEEEVPLGDLSTTSDSSFTYRGAKVACNLNEGYSIARVIGTEPFATKTPALKRDETYVAEADSETVVNNAYNNLTEEQRREYDSYCHNLSEAAAHGAVSYAERPSWLTDALYSQLTGGNSQLAINEEGLSGTFTRPHSPAYEYLEDANSESEVLKTLTKVPEILKNVLGVENNVDNFDMTSMGYIVNGNRADMLSCDRMIRIKHGAAQYATSTEYSDTYRKTEKHKITTTEGVFSPLIFISNTQLNQASKDIYSFENKTRTETVDKSAIKSTFSLRHTNLVNANVDRDLNAERTIGTADGTDIRFTLIPEVLMTYKTGYLDNKDEYIPDKDKWQRGKIGTAYVAGYNEYQVELPAFNKTTLNYTLNETTATDLTKSQEGNGIVIASTGVATTSATKNLTSTSGVFNDVSNVAGSEEKLSVTAVPVIYTGATMTAGLNFNKSVADANTLKLDSWVLNYNVDPNDVKSIPEYWNVQDNGTLSGMGMKYANLWLDTMKTNGKFIMTADLRNSFDVKNKDITTTETYELSSINESGNSYDARDKVTYPVEFRNGRLARVCINGTWVTVYDEGITSVDEFKNNKTVYNRLNNADSELCEAICEMDLFSFAQTLRSNDGNENFNSYKNKSIYNGNTGVSNERKTVVDKVEEARVDWGYKCGDKNWYSEDSTVFQIEHYTKTLNLPDSLDLTWKIPVGHGPSSTSTAGGTNGDWLGSIHVGVRLGNNDYSKYSLVGNPYSDDKKYPSTMEEYKCFKISSLSVNDR